MKDTMIITLMQIEFIKIIRVDNKVEVITTANTINRRIRAQDSWCMRKKRQKERWGGEFGTFYKFLNCFTG